MAVVLDAQGTFLAGANTAHVQAVVPAPAGLTAAKMPIVGLLLENRTNNALPVTPVDAGWTLWDPAGLGYTFGLSSPALSAMFCRIYHYEPRGTPSSWTFDWTGGCWRAAKALSFTGALATGSPFRYGGATSMASNSVSTANSPGVTFTNYVLGDYGIWFLVHFNGWAAAMHTGGVLVNATPEADWALINTADADKDIAFGGKLRAASGTLTSYVVPTGRNGAQAAMLAGIVPAATTLPRRFVQSRAALVRASTW